MSALAQGPDHPPGVTTFPAVRSTMKTLPAQRIHAICMFPQALSECGRSVMEGVAVSVGRMSRKA
jgi:hypothetical protein